MYLECQGTKHWSTKNSLADQKFIGQLVAGKQKQKKPTKYLKLCLVKIKSKSMWLAAGLCMKGWRAFNFKGQIQAVTLSVGGFFFNTAGPFDIALDS